MRLFFILAFNNLRYHPVRTSLVGGCIASVCALMVMLLALSFGVKHSLTEGAIALTSGHLNIHGYYKISGGTAIPLIKGKDKLSKIARENSPDGVQVLGRLKAFGKVISPAKTIHRVIWGIDPQAESVTLGRLIAAREPGLTGATGVVRRGTIALFEAQAKKLGVAPGDLVTVALPAYRGGLQTLDLRVTSILRDMGVLSRFNAYVDAKELSELFSLEADTTGELMLFFKDPATADAGRLAQALSRAGYDFINADPATSFWTKLEGAGGDSFLGGRLEVTSWRDEIAPLAWILDVFTAFTWLVTVTLLTLVILGLIHTQTMAIHERSAETDTMRAIGLSRKRTLAMFFIESLLLALGGCLLGLAMGLLGCALLNAIGLPVTAETLQLFLMSDRLNFRIEPAALIAPLMFIGLMVSAGSLIPAWRASNRRAGTF